MQERQTPVGSRATEAFGTAGNRVIAHGTAAAMEMIGRLSAEERKLLAQHIRQRGAGGRKK